ncbi:hypothetical protein ACA910_008068 [Epithemia clementina (nom. ined.)]
MKYDRSSPSPSPSNLFRRRQTRLLVGLGLLLVGLQPHSCTFAATTIVASTPRAAATQQHDRPRQQSPTSDEKVPISATKESFDSSPLFCLVQRAVYMRQEERFMGGQNLDDDDDDNDLWICEPLNPLTGTTSGSYRFNLDLLSGDIAQHIRASLLHHDYTQRLDKPNHILLKIPGGRLTLDRVYIPDPTLVTLVQDDNDDDDENKALRREQDRSFLHQYRRQLRNPPSKGELRTVMIRISTSDSSPTFTAEELQNVLYHSTVANPKRQFELCSFGQLTLLEPNDMGGILDIYLPNVTARGNTPGVLTNEAEAVANAYLSEQYGIANIRSWTDMLMFVVPPGTGGWAAFATVSGKQSTFNDGWGAYMGAVMHELGHNLGLRHAFEGGEEYGARTGYMGGAPTETETPQKCFNAHNHYQLGWFAPHTVDLDPAVLSLEPQLVWVAAFVDYDLIQEGVEYVVVKMGDLYIQYNRATKHNIETEEYPNTLEVVRGESDKTDLLGALSVDTAGGGPSNFTLNDGSNVVVSLRVCAVDNRDDNNNNNNDSTNADRLLVSISTQGNPHACPSPPSATSPAPTTVPPTLTPTNVPSATPPTTRPTATPVSSFPVPNSAYPTTSSRPSVTAAAPTSSPTVHPTAGPVSPVPSSAPTTSDSFPPSNPPIASVQPTKSPTTLAAPSFDPTLVPTPTANPTVSWRPTLIIVDSSSTNTTVSSLRGTSGNLRVQNFPVIFSVAALSVTFVLGLILWIRCRVARKKDGHSLTNNPSQAKSDFDSASSSSSTAMSPFNTSRENSFSMDMDDIFRPTWLDQPKPRLERISTPERTSSTKHDQSKAKEEQQQLEDAEESSVASFSSFASSVSTTSVYLEDEIDVESKSVLDGDCDACSES